MDENSKRRQCKQIIYFAAYATCMMNAESTTNTYQSLKKLMIILTVNNCLKLSLTVMLLQTAKMLYGNRRIFHDEGDIRPSHVNLNSGNVIFEW
jgi:hypothetical protein